MVLISFIRNGVALSDATLEKSKYDPSVALRLSHNLTVSREECTEIPQQLGGSYSWDDIADAAADIYSGVGTCIGMLSLLRLVC